MLIISTIIGIAGPLVEFWYLLDYWRPETFTGWRIGLEDFLFGFFFGGISGLIYEELFGKHHSKRHNRKHHWLWFIVPILGSAILLMNLMVSAFGINSIYAAILIFVVTSLIILYFRHDLLIVSLASGILVGVIMLLGYLVFLSLFPEAIHRWWILNNISGILIYGIPAEELMWAFGWGMVAGPMYEFFTGLKFKNTSGFL
ncbi:MAG: hypothetical protein A2751_04150 [Candidatus Doudnabacteria bacterium RIFCSPHIGHO2_01_FULL_46_14]|uniref:Lycopene cyclase domain-containing protein n=1 Tax=Candidatus Doudnabacteria bacterium RIFCSPHIGHO2_01_FULL_46_14 TaxID=1817824 RepID=A0A1F5NLA9_9BACT|nr:MAG: hypothetical protein A2751_04150 [Candidatus Doudnabacteria bacterium RIFCSPHIGHO2_01_FULL_46_14]